MIYISSCTYIIKYEQTFLEPMMFACLLNYPMKYPRQFDRKQKTKKTQPSVSMSERSKGWGTEIILELTVNRCTGRRQGPECRSYIRTVVISLLILVWLNCKLNRIRLETKHLDHYERFDAHCQMPGWNCNFEDVIRFVLVCSKIKCILFFSGLVGIRGNAWGGRRKEKKRKSLWWR